MTPEEIKLLMAALGSLGTGAVAVMFAMLWVKAVISERTNDLKDWNEYLKGAREKDRDNFRAIIDTVQGLTKLAAGPKQPPG